MVLGDGEPPDESLHVLHLFGRGAGVRPIGVEDVLADLVDHELERRHPTRNELGMVALDREGDELQKPSLRGRVCVGRRPPPQPRREGNISASAVLGDALGSREAVEVVPPRAPVAEPEHVLFEREETVVATVGATDANKSSLQRS